VVLEKIATSLDNGPHAVHWNSLLSVFDPPYPDDIIASEQTLDVRVLAHGVGGILDLSGLKFDAKGRLLPVAA
jgi:hypothetical protein